MLFIFSHYDWNKAGDQNVSFLPSFCTFYAHPPHSNTSTYKGNKEILQMEKVKRKDSSNIYPT